MGRHTRFNIVEIARVGTSKDWTDVEIDLAGLDGTTIGLALPASRLDELTKRMMRLLAHVRTQTTLRDDTLPTSTVRAAAERYTVHAINDRILLAIRAADGTRYHFSLPRGTADELSADLSDAADSHKNRR